MFTIETTVEFSASHQLNHPYVGDCNRNHGHNYIVTAVVGSDSLDKCRMVMDFKRFKAHLMMITNHMDHRCLNDLFADTTAEFLAESIAEQLQKALDKDIIDNRKLWVVRISVAETARNIASWIRSVYV